MNFVIKLITLFFFLLININFASAQSGDELWERCKEKVDQGYKFHEVKACQTFSWRYYEYPRLQKSISSIFDQDLVVIPIPCLYKNCIEYPSIYPWIVESVLDLGDPNPQPSRETGLLLESAIELQSTLKELVSGLDIYIKEIQ